MAANEHYHGSNEGYYPHERNVGPSLPSLPNLHTQQQYAPLVLDRSHDSPLSPVYTQSSFNPSRIGIDETDPSYHGASHTGKSYGKRHYSDEIPLAEHPQDISGQQQYPAQRDPQDGTLPSPAAAEPRRKDRQHNRKKGFFSRKIPWVVYILTTIQSIVFIVELIKNGETSIRILLRNY